MTVAHSIGTTKELERFFDFIYGDEEGWAYSPTKDPNSDAFEQYFFAWPKQREALIQHVINHMHTREVYSSPALFSKEDATKDSFKGTRVIWAEFDGKLPVDLKGIPEPSVKIQSSRSNYQHWYWRVDGFITDIDILESLTRRITYGLSADLSIWNANRVLRPPGSIHHESNNTVSVLRWDTRLIGITSFADIPEIPVKFLDIGDIGNVPDVLDVLMKYPFDTEETAFFRVRELPTAEGKAHGTGHRSAALAKLGHICMEKGMSNGETLSVVRNAADRWGKFKNRRDIVERLLGIINYCRAKHLDKMADPPVDSIVVKHKILVYNYEEFFDNAPSMEWIIPELLIANGLASMSGPSGIGKSQLLLRFCEKIALGQPWLKWTPTAPQKMIYVSMEMPYVGLMEFLETMNFHNNPLLKENFHVAPIGSSLRLATKPGQGLLLEAIEEHKPQGLVFDSFGMALGDDLNSEKIILEVFDFVKKLVNHYGFWVWFIHHPRKEQIGNKKPNRLSDLFGSGYYGNELDLAISLWPSGDNIEVTNLKHRYKATFETFKLQRTPNLDFEVVTNKLIRANGNTIAYDAEGNPVEFGGF